MAHKKGDCENCRWYDFEDVDLEVSSEYWQCKHENAMEFGCPLWVRKSKLDQWRKDMKILAEKIYSERLKWRKDMKILTEKIYSERLKTEEKKEE